MYEFMYILVQKLINLVAFFAIALLIALYLSYNLNLNGKIQLIALLEISKI